MVEYTNKTQQFINNCHPMTSELANIVIVQFGGEDAFLAAYESSCENGVINRIIGWDNTAQLKKFYANNQSEILGFAEIIAVGMAFGDKATMLQDFIRLSNKHTYEVSLIDDAITNTENEIHHVVIIALCALVAEGLACAYAQFIANNPA